MMFFYLPLNCLFYENYKQMIWFWRDIFGDYVLRVGQTEDIKLEVVVGNSEEEAHETMLFVTLPPSLLYIGLDERVS